MIEIETATVYRSSRRRWFTKEWAAKALAREKINERCDCELADQPYEIDYRCRYHDNDMAYYLAVRDRLAGFYLRQLNARETTGRRDQ